MYSPDATYINSTSETNTTDKLLLREPGDLGYKYSYLERETNILKIVGNNVSTDPEVDINLYRGVSSESPDLQITTNGIYTDNISCVTLRGDISSNLLSGANITLSTDAEGITTITALGGSVDPLNISNGNISVLNSSTINVDMLNAINI